MKIILHYREVLADIHSNEPHSELKTASSDGSDGEASLPNAKEEPSKLIAEDDIIVVVDPFSSGRNLCSRSPYFFRSKRISEQLRALFNKGLRELSSFVHMSSTTEAECGESEHSSVDFNEAIFPWTSALLRSRRDTIYEHAAPSEDAAAAAYHFICMNSSFAYNYKMPAAAAAAAVTEGFTEATKNMEKMITFATQILSRKVRW